MDSPDRPGDKPLMLEVFENDYEDRGLPARGVRLWTSPCEARAHQPQQVAVFLSLHCPRCGQLASLDSSPSDKPCLLDRACLHAFLLEGRHHEFDH